MLQLLLASASPRRADLLRTAGFDFKIKPASVNENLRVNELPEAYVKRLAEAKATAVVEFAGNRTVLGADTIVVVNKQILGKPINAGDASRMLHLLSGRHHEVLTGITVIGPPLVGQERLRLTSFTATRVEMAVLSESEIEWYVSTGEPLDKAGAYAIQGLASRFIRHIEGSHSNVVGLPISLVYSMLKKVISLTS
jgi:septum formation protein